MLDFIPVAGWIASFAVGALSIYLSGMGYLKALKLMHGNKSKRDLDIERGLRAMNDNKSINSGTGQKAIKNQ